ncbi:MAG: hypothetical protein GX241_00345 [Ruminococcaceae bacterium]|nr:hypothetical protein [Oscillospiraceae bacterium]
MSLCSKKKADIEKIKHYFIVNPTAGKGLRGKFVKNTIIPACKAAKIDYEIYYTKAAGDGQQFVKEIAKKGDPVRFYACGGDGTLYEVVNGAYGYPNAQIAAVPLGSGNDWIKIFGDIEVFHDIEGQINGIPLVIDCIQAGDEIAINQASMGFDADACAVQGEMKKLPGAAGHVSYFLGGLYCMFTKVKNDFDIEIDGVKYEGPFVFAAGCNSRWYGSGIKVAPFADITDHKLDFVLMKRKQPWIIMFFIMLLDWQNNKDTHVHYKHCEYIRGKKMTVRDRQERNHYTNIDGECHRTNEITIELAEKPLTFIVPKKSTYFEDIESGKISGEIKIDEKKYTLKRGLF